MEYDNCEYCGGKVVERKIKMNYYLKGAFLIIEDVPAGVCEECGERYYDAKVLKEVERIAKAKEGIVRMISVSVKKFESAITS